jgi:molecular chaperone DnaJ
VRRSGVHDHDDERIDVDRDVGGAVTHYEVLGVAPTAATSEVREAYVRLARRHHPDRAGGDDEAMRAINDAWSILGDPTRRASYDRGLGRVAEGPPAAAPRATSELDDLLADLEDDTPIGGRVVLPRWLSLVPVAAFAASVAIFVIGVLFSSSAALAASVACFVLSCALFLCAPFVALLASRRGR